ncbi:hypothetical protein HDC30_005247 [Pseudomonas sp. JAI115]|nr:hypothetical protein [Pseudomonas sp. JAI115]
MVSSSKSFDRKASRFKPQPKVLVLCEDSKSGKRYLEEAAFHFRARAQVEIVHCGVTHPSGIVERAVMRQKRFDKVFCVVDRDTHLCFERALNTARSHPKIYVIASHRIRVSSSGFFCTLVSVASHSGPWGKAPQVTW